MENLIFKNAKWISADMGLDNRTAPIFKKNFVIKNDIESAVAYICGLGLFEMKINGTLPDDSVLNPAHTQYSKRVLYRKFDVKDLLCENANEITVELGHSFFNEPGGVWNWEKASWRSVPKLIFALEITYKNGEKETVVSDESWLVTLDGNTVFNSIYAGETFDARKKEFIWSDAKIADAPTGKLVLQNMPPIRRIEVFKPEKIEKNSGSIIITAPEMITGWVKIRINEPKDREVTISYCEQLDKNGFAPLIGKGEGRDGTWWPDYYIQRDKFISDGEPFVFEPKFSYKGFKYIQIDNVSDLTADDIVIYRVANDVLSVGEFECSDETVNALHKLMRRTILNNLQGKPTDTPVWEKNGWLGDFSCGLLSMIYNFDMSSFSASFIDTMADCFSEFGNVPVMVPSADWSTENSPVWNTVFVFACEALLDFYSMNDYVSELYPTLKEFAQQDINELSANGWVWGVRGLADWVSPNGGAELPANPGSSEGCEICGTGYIYGMLRTMSRIAGKLGKTQDIALYNEAAEKIYDAFNSKFYNEEKGFYETFHWKQIGKRIKYRQTSNLVPLYFGMVPENRKNAVLENLVSAIKENGYHLDTGCTGTKMLLPVLFDNGYCDAAYRILTQKTYPSWGYWLEKGDDSAWESWEDETRSKDHYFLATYEEALFSHIAGIRNVKDGFTHFTVAPCIENGFDYAKASINTANGKVCSSWQKNSDGTFTVKIAIPENCTADVVINANGKSMSETVSGDNKEYRI